ncbi:NupC/NupG family nucleoside CNT transporter [Parvularcula dongshanensis]|uniref:CNT family concentrative nucleoside transporter n=1 Tax=Parvularcula dongshanensis TaxID=1173995 RepID=A0A840I533_9PROT|nr:nucleoside transporter C-terminal domain-containing protein [Parvularcula dongshanensis]MBB4659887.1 CNT family concentrative nucleoside transporter [Parvularcula dongshanensis]
MDFTAIGPRLQSVLGLFAFCGIAWALSERKSAFPWRQVAITLPLQIVLAAFFLRVPAARNSLDALNGLVAAVSAATQQGTEFLFGYVGSTDTPFAVTGENGGLLFVFAFQALPLLVVVSALSAVLWHWGILKLVIRGFALVLSRVLGTGGAVSLAASANVLLGQTEAPLLIRAYLASLTRAELFAVITCGYATVAGTVMVLYATILGTLRPDVLGHIIVASIIAVLGGLLLARIMVPPREGEEATTAAAGEGFEYEDTMDAFVTGATEGGKLWANIIIAILAFVALVGLLNIIMGAWLPDVNGAPLTLERMLGWLFAPLVWLAGIPAGEAMDAGELMGIKTAVNEVVAYIALVGSEPGTFDPRSELVMIYALCGFANVSSIGIVIGGLSALEPSRRRDVLDLAPKGIVAGTLATLGSGACVGLVY